MKTGIISPSKSKIRMKLMGMGSPSQRKKDGSNSNSSRTSPARLDDSEFLNNSLLASTPDEWGIQAQVESLEEDSSVTRRCSSSQSVSNSSAVHPLKSMEDENLDYDSNASSSSFEFHKGERPARSMARPFSRQTSYKWNSAEKWIVNKQGSQCGYPKGQNVKPQGNRMAAAYDYDCRLQSRVMDPQRVDFCQPATHMSLDKFSLPHSRAQSNSFENLYPQTKDSEGDSSGDPAIREVSMRDMGTEMTPIPSQEPSRTATPVGATTPLCSPTSSLPSTARGGHPPRNSGKNRMVQHKTEKRNCQSKSESSRREKRL